MNPRNEIRRNCDERVRTIKAATQDGIRLTPQEQQSVRRLIHNAIKWDCDSAAFALSVALEENLVVM